MKWPFKLITKCFFMVLITTWAASRIVSRSLDDAKRQNWTLVAVHRSKIFICVMREAKRYYVSLPRNSQAAAWHFGKLSRTKLRFQLMNTWTNHKKLRKKFKTRNATLKMQVKCCGEVLKITWIEILFCV